MKGLLYYFIQLLGASGILYSYYHFVLRNKKFHHYNRFYLLAAVIVSILIPFLNIPVYFTAEEARSSLVLQTLSNISPGEAESIVVDANRSVVGQSKINWLTWQNLSYVFYLLIALLALTKIIFSLKRIKAIIKKNPVERLDNIQFVNTDEPGTPFSFFRWLFWNRKLELRSEKGEQVFRHELFHIEQKHSWDIMFMEIITMVFWINPFFHLIKKELKAIHEFLADEFAMKKTERSEYAELLLMHVLSTTNPLLNPFFNNQIKRRIAMIFSSEKASFQYLRKLMVLPIALIVVGLFAFTYRANKKTSSAELSKPITVVIDAGHGMDQNGNYTGVKGLDGSYEDEIVLGIVEKIKELNTNENIHILLTRETKYVVDLHQRSNISNQQNADLFISVHANTAAADDPATSGTQVYISRKNKNFSNENNLLGKILLSNFANATKSNTDVKTRETGIFVLDNSNCPAAIVECGFMSDRVDLNFMRSNSGQQQIAKAILKSIEEYGSQKRSINSESVNNNIIVDTIPRVSKGFNNALIVIDGKISDSTALGALDVMTIKSIKIIKNNQATDKYGERGKNGVIEIITKNGAMIVEKSKGVKDDHAIPKEIAQQLLEKAYIALQTSDVKSFVSLWYLDNTGNPHDNTIFDAPQVVQEFSELRNFLKIPIEKKLAISRLEIDKMSPFFKATYKIKGWFAINDSVSKGYGFLVDYLNGKWQFRWHGETSVIGGDEDADQVKTKLPSVQESNSDLSAFESYDYFKLNFNDPEVKKRWREMISEIKAIAWKEGKAAYEYKGRTYIFGRIKNPDPKIAAFTEQNGVGHVFILNSELITSVAELNNRIKRSDVSKFGFIEPEVAKKRFNRNEHIVFIETDDYVTKNN